MIGEQKQPKASSQLENEEEVTRFFLFFLSFPLVPKVANFTLPWCTRREWMSSKTAAAPANSYVQTSSSSLFLGRHFMLQWFTALSVERGKARKTKLLWNERSIPGSQRCQAAAMRQNGIFVVVLFFLVFSFVVSVRDCIQRQSVSWSVAGFEFQMKCLVLWWWWWCKYFLFLR